MCENPFCCAQNALFFWSKVCSAAAPPGAASAAGAGAAATAAGTGPATWGPALCMSANDLSGNSEPGYQAMMCAIKAILSILACICKKTHFWPDGVHTFCPDSDAPFYTQGLRIPAMHRCPNRTRRTRMRIRIRSTRCIAHSSALLAGADGAPELRERGDHRPHFLGCSHFYLIKMDS